MIWADKVIVPAPTSDILKKAIDEALTVLLERMFQPPAVSPPTPEYVYHDEMVPGVIRQIEITCSFQSKPRKYPGDCPCGMLASQCEYPRDC